MCVARQLGVWATSATPQPCPLWCAPWQTPFPRCAGKPSPRFSFCGRQRPEAAALDALRDRDDTVRYIAAQLLGHHRTHRALDALFLTLTDDNIWVRAESARTLGRIGDTTAVGPLERMFAERDGPDHEAAKEALHLLTGLNYAVAP